MPAYFKKIHSAKELFPVVPSDTTLHYDTYAWINFGYTSYISRNNIPDVFYAPKM